MAFKLRPYQEQCVTKALWHFSQRRKNKRPLIVAPTAAGKSIIIAEIANRLDGKILILQPTKELLLQNYEKYCVEGRTASIYSASVGQKEISGVTFATIGSIKGIASEFTGYSMIIDEAHLFPPMKDSMFGKFVIDSGITAAVGLTATPFRLKKNTLKMLNRMRPLFFNELLHIIQVSEIVEGGFWAKMLYGVFDFDESKLELNTTGSDYKEGSMRAAYKANDIQSALVKRTADARLAGRKSILIFVPSVADGAALSAAIPGSVMVHGDMGVKERDAAIAGFKSGAIDVAVNVNVLSVGFDHPGIDTIFVARPTMSLAWYYQAIGRGTRPGPKENCVVQDFAGNFKKFGKLENIEIQNIDGYGWGVFGGEHGRLLTGVPMDGSIGLFTKETAVGVKKAQSQFYRPQFAQ